MADEKTFWDEDEKPASMKEEGLVLDIAGFEGPLDLLLSLARNQKVDLAKISILELTEQYLTFIEKVCEMRLEVAADYLVMAAWLAYLKSRLLLPDENPAEEESAEELAQLLAFRLKRLEAMRNAAKLLMNRNRLGQDIFARGDPEPITVIRQKEYADTLYDLLTAYATQRQRNAVTTHRVVARKVWSLQEARETLQRLIGKTSEWSSLDDYLLQYALEPELRRSALASSFSASLELVREGAAEIRQSEAYAPLYLRKVPEETNHET